MCVRSFDFGMAEFVDENYEKEDDSQREIDTRIVDFENIVENKIEEVGERTGGDEEGEDEEERDNIGLTSASNPKDISNYLQRDGDGDSSDDEEKDCVVEYDKYQQNNDTDDVDGDNDEEENNQSYELVDDGYTQQCSQESDEEFGEFKEASGNLSINGNGHGENDPNNAIEEEEEDKNGYHHHEPTPDYKIPSFPVNKSRIPPLTADKIDCIKKAMQSLNITPRPTAERIVSAVIAARPRLGDEESLQTQSFQGETIPTLPSPDFANFDEHFNGSER